MKGRDWDGSERQNEVADVRIRYNIILNANCSLQKCYLILFQCGCKEDHSISH